MLTQELSQQTSLQNAIAASQNYLLSLQYPEGYWWSELESNVTITAEIVILHKIWGTDKQRPLHKVEAYLRSQQRQHGGWELFYGDGGDLSTSVEAYMALKVLGVSPDDEAMLRAKDFILEKGGISKSRIFTKIHLALIGCYDWRGVPSIPPWIMLLNESFPFTIYEMSSWARSSTVPLIIVCDRKPIYQLEQPITLDELYTEGIENVKYTLPRSGDWSDIFVTLDQIFKLQEKLNLVPFREKSLKAAEKWVLERQEVSGDWGGIIPAMLNSLLALRCLDYDVADPIVQRGLKAVDNFAMENGTEYWVQPCVSPVWDTAWALRALVESGIAPDHPALVKGGDWLIEKQILDYGDWIVKNKQGKPGAWAFEFDNRFYPDVDDSAVVVMTLNQLKLPNESLKRGAIARCVAWIASMQCRPGGWAAFDLDNDQEWLNALPYADLKAMIDPNTADVTARVLEMLGELDHSQEAFLMGLEPKDRDSLVKSLSLDNLKRAISYLVNEQESDGSWFGRWGVNYIYGTSGALSALALITPQSQQESLQKGANWLVSCQNADGGWGETCRSYNNPNLKGQGHSTPSQTAWALIGLMAAGEATGNMATTAIERGINYLLLTQQSNGTWAEAEFTGTGFPCHFYLNYHLYRHYFPLLALGRYQRLANR